MQLHGDEMEIGCSNNVKKATKELLTLHHLYLRNFVLADKRAV